MEYNPKEVADIAGAYASLYALQKQLGDGQRLGIIGGTVSSLKRETEKYCRIIPPEVGKFLNPSVGNLEKSIVATLESLND